MAVADDRELVVWMKRDQKRSQQAFGGVDLEMRPLRRLLVQAVASEYY